MLEDKAARYYGKPVWIADVTETDLAPAIAQVKRAASSALKKSRRVTIIVFEKPTSEGADHGTSDKNGTGHTG